jgi:hypothetical protein
MTAHNLREMSMEVVLSNHNNLEIEELKRELESMRSKIERLDHDAASLVRGLGRRVGRLETILIIGFVLILFLK